ncbi:MAG: PorV/PorQ family protein [Candidatus Saganbacteria bacterium]|nr:PorV/PorQ family protein [Candidatus Saganbacteria bacterium]
MKNKFFALIFTTFILLNCATPLLGTATDPFRIGMGARPLAMGKTFVGIADDANVLFLNPAGLPSLNGEQVISMYSNVTDDTNYLLLAGTYTTRIGRIGLGLLSIGVGDIYSTSRDSYGRVTIDSTFSYSNQVFLLSWGKKLRSNLNLGLSGKLYQENMSGISGGSASGYGIDLGLLYDFSPSLNFGLLYRNFLTTSLEWKTGRKAALPRLGKIGLGFYPRSNITFGLDLDLQANKPPLLHVGSEWRLNNFFALRGGLDQSAISQFETVINYGLGLGLRMGEVSFDYTYTIDPDLQYNNTHYFSISFGALRKEVGQTEREKLEAERLERERLEKEKREKERLEKERLRKERIEKARLERSNRERIRQERNRLEREKQELKEKDKREKQEKDRLERERITRLRPSKPKTNIFSNIGNALGAIGNNIGKGLGVTGQNIGNALGAVGNNIGKGIGTTGQNIGNIVSKTGTAIGTAAGNTGRVLGTVAGNTGKAIGSAVGNTGKALGAAGKNIGTAIGSTGKNIGTVIDNVASTIKNLFGLKPSTEDLERELERARAIERGEAVPEETLTIRESFEIIRKVIAGEKPLQELGKAIPQIATNLLILALKAGIFLFVLFVLLMLFKEWKKRTNQ